MRKNFRFAAQKGWAILCTKTETERTCPQKDRSMSPISALASERVKTCSLGTTTPAPKLAPGGEELKKGRAQW